MFGFVSKIFRKESSNAKIGRMGERDAAKFLSKTMKIVARNFRSGRNEIDIVALDGQCLVFVEVKTRSENTLVDGYYHAVSKSKRNAVKNCARDFMKRTTLKYLSWRFDVVEIRHDNSGKITSLNHFENVHF